MQDVKIPAKSQAAADVTFLVPFYDRIEHFKRYWESGLWDNVQLQLVCDGSSREFVRELRNLTQESPDVSVHALPVNRGAGRARSEGFQRIPTQFVAVCDDDDFIPDASLYADRAARTFREAPDTLLVTAADVVAFRNGGGAAVQYGRRWMHERSGRQLLDFIVRTGEIQALMPSVYRTEDVRGLEVNDIFKRNQDLVALVRLCAKLPEARVRVLDDARYARLIHQNSISSRRDFTVEHLYNHALAMIVGAYHLVSLDGIARAEIPDILRRRGEVMQKSVRRGRDVFFAFADLLEGRERKSIITPDGREVIGLLEEQWDELPPEYSEIVPVNHCSLRPPDPADYDTLRTRAMVRYEGGDLEAAERELIRATEVAPARVEAHILLAAVLRDRGLLDRAEKAALRAAACDPEHPQVQIELGLISERQGNVEAALKHFSTAHVNLETHLRTARDGDEWKCNGLKGEYPTNLDQLHSLASEVKDHIGFLNRTVMNGRPAARLKIGVICGPDRKFLKDIVNRLSDRHMIRTVYFDEVPQSSLGGEERTRIQEVIDWSDVTWFEWCDDLLRYASVSLTKSSRIVVRLHSYEAFLNLSTSINWDFVDHVVFVADHICEHVRSRVDSLPDASVISNGVDLDRFSYKASSPGFDLAYVGYINFKKNPELLLQIIGKLRNIDSRYILHIAGQFQQERYVLYFNNMIKSLGLSDNIKFYGWVDDVGTWLESKQYILSTSLLEGCPVGIIQAMAKGLKPIIHNWPGAAGLFPKDFLFNTVDEAVSSIITPDYHSQRYRAFVAEKHDVRTQVKMIEDLLLRVAQNDSGGTTLLSGVEDGKRAPRVRSEQQGHQASDRPPISLISREDLELLRTEWGNSDWAASIEYLEEMVRLASTAEGPILECGTGLTTIVLGIIAKSRGLDVWSLEHDFRWYERIHEIAVQNELDEVKICYSPLRSCGDYAWYDAPLSEMPDNFDLVVCDGPPSATPGGRYGLMPEMASRLSSDCVILLDDAARPGEQEALTTWRADYGVSFEMRDGVRPFGIMRLVSGY